MARKKDQIPESELRWLAAQESHAGAAIGFTNASIAKVSTERDLRAAQAALAEAQQAADNAASAFQIARRDLHTASMELDAARGGES